MTLKRIVVILICLTFMQAFSSAMASTTVSAKLLAAIKKTKGTAAYGRVKAWQALINNNKNKSTKDKLKLTNHFFNRFTYRSDQALVGKEDYWMTPLEFAVRGTGDCEDYAIAKYFTLKALNVPQNKLQIVYAKSVKYNRAHMVLAYYETPSSDPLILDSLTNEISTGSNRTDLIPTYSFNAGGLWLAKQRGMGKQVGSSDRLSAWQGVIRRMGRFIYE